VPAAAGAPADCAEKPSPAPAGCRFPSSGDVVTIESVAGLDPAIVDGSGVIPPSAVPEYVRAIRREVTDRGPGPHILTGPVFVNGTLLGDVLELRIQQIDLAVDYGNNVERPYRPGVFTFLHGDQPRPSRGPGLGEWLPGFSPPFFPHFGQKLPDGSQRLVFTSTFVRGHGGRTRKRSRGISTRSVGEKTGSR